MFIKGLVKLFHPDDIGDITGPAGSKNQGVESDLKFLKEGTDDKPEEKDTTEEEHDESDKEDEERDEDDTDDTEENQDKDESEEGDEGDEGDEDEDDSVAGEDEDVKITVKGIKKDFPDFFKKHPEMRGVIFREKQFSEIYATPQEAQQAATFANNYLKMEQDLVHNSDSGPLLKALKKANEGKNFDTFISNFLPELFKVDKDSYYKLAAVPLKRALRHAFKEGERTDNKNLRLAAEWIHNHVFQNNDINEQAEFESTAKKSEKSKEQVEYESKINALNLRAHTDFKKSIDEEWGAGVKESFFSNLDPDNILSDWTKNKMFEEALAQIDEQLSKDTRYMRGVDSLWAQARSGGFDRSFKTRIVNTSLARAKQIIPTIRQKLRAEALSERRRITKDKSNSNSKEVRRVVSGGDSKGGKKFTKSDARNTRRMSELDVIRS